MKAKRSTLPSSWDDPARARAYAENRWRSTSAASRDRRLIERALRRIELAPRPSILDAPCGAGRLFQTLGGDGYLGVDLARPMLEEAVRQEVRPLLCADLGQLPFADDTFDLVVSCRILHHAADPESFQQLVRELVRVSRGWVIASFFDRGSWHALRKRVLRRLRRDDRGRVARRRAELRATFRRAGAGVQFFEHSLRFWSQQTFAVARKEC